MKKATILSALLVAFTLSPAANATLLVGWHNFEGGNNTVNTPVENADIAATGYSGNYYIRVGANYSVDSGGSNDGFYGNSGIAVTQNGLQLPTNDGYARLLNGPIRFEMTNTGGGETTLQNLFFDASKQSAGGTVSVNYRIHDGISDGPLQFLGTTTNLPASPTYLNMAFSLMSLPLLQIGQTIKFEFTASDNARIDNVAIAGISAIPEPASLLAIGCVLGSGLMLRNRRRPSLTAA